LISNDVSNGFLPVAVGWRSLFLRAYLLNNTIKIVLCNGLEDFFNKGIFLMSEILLFDLIKKFLTSSFSNQ
jgi:hypothetical protein